MVGYESPIGLIWSRIACFKGDYSLLAENDIDKTTKVAAMLNYNTKTKIPASPLLFNMPVAVRLAFSKKFGKDVKYSAQAHFGQQLVVRDTLECPLASNLKLTLRGEQNLNNFLTNPGSSVKLPGVQLDLSL